MGRLFQVSQEGIFLGLYSKGMGVVHATPKGTEHVAHVTWLKPGAASDTNRANIDYFLVNGDIDPRYITEDSFAIPSFKMSAEMRDTEAKRGMSYKIISGFRDRTEAIKRIAVCDVYAHNVGRRLPTLEDSSPRLIYTDRIDSEAVITKVGHVSIDLGGKQTFYPSCVLDLNLDFANWCIAEIMRDGKLNTLNSCDYCYAAYKHKGYPHVYGVEVRELVEQIERAKQERAKEGLPTRYLRLGKRTEAGADIFREQIVSTLEACINTGLSAIFPTKHLAFNKEIAELLKRTDSTLLFSFGNDQLERGACEHGCSNEWRFEQAREYLSAGVRAVPYILIDATKENGGELFRDNLTKALKFPNVQLIPVRVRHRRNANKILGGHYSVVGGHSEDLFGDSYGGYELAPDHTRLAVNIHPSITDLVKDNAGNTRMCHHNNNCSWCGKCFIGEEKGDVVSAHKPIIVKDNLVKWPHKGRKRPNGSEFDFSEKKGKR